jgi:hypothetical protein
MVQPQLTRDSMIGPYPLPPVDDALRAQARAQPGQWLDFLDPMIDPATPNPPAFAVQGGYRADELGQIVEYSINPRYEPSELRAGFRCSSAFELTLWRALHGFNTVGMLADAFASATLLAYVDHPGAEDLPAVPDPDQPGTSLLLVCSSWTFCSWENAVEVTGSFLLGLTSNTDAVLIINPGTGLSLRLAARTMMSLARTPHQQHQ